MDDLRRQLTPYLLPDEQLLWLGRPDPGKHLGPGDAYHVPFSVLWCGFSLFWITTAATSGAPVPFVLFGVPFVALGLYMVAGRFVVKARRKQRTAYGLTARRALVAVGAREMSEAPLQGQPVAQSRSRDGRHLTVTFGRPAGGWASGPSHANTGMEFLQQGSAQVGFFDVADVSGLEAALRHARR